MHTVSSNCLIDMKSYWAHDNHIIGQCYIDPTEQYFFINIPKNASSWAKEILSQLKWKAGDYIHQDVTSMLGIIFLRDPVERWISGISTWILNGRTHITFDDLTNGPILKLILDKITFDSHTEKQKHFLHSIDTNQCVCFYVDGYLEKKFSNWYCTNIDNTANINYNVNKNKPRSADYYQFFKNHVGSNPNVKQQLIEYFKEDYELIEQYQKMNLFYNFTQPGELG